MSEQPIDRHTDPSGLLESLRAPGGSRPYLGSLADVERAVRGFASDVLTRYDEVGHGVLTPADAANADRDACLRLARVFCGEDAAYSPVKDWTGAPLAASLRDSMGHLLQPDDDDVQILAQVFAVFVHSLYDLIRDMNGGAPSDEVTETLEKAVRSLAFSLLGVGKDA